MNCGDCRPEDRNPPQVLVELVACKAFHGKWFRLESVMSMVFPCRKKSRFRILFSPVVFLELGRTDKKTPPFVSCPKHSRVGLSAVLVVRSSAKRG